MSKTTTLPPLTAGELMALGAIAQVRGHDALAARCYALGNALPVPALQE